jgi:hypothetical protein
MSYSAADSHHTVSPLEEPQLNTGPVPPTAYVSRPRFIETGHSNEKSFHSIFEQALLSDDQSQLPRAKWKNKEYWWPWEWLCELLAVGSLAAMVVLLMFYHGKPQAEWRQSCFTLNGLVAFLATLTKTGLIIPVSAAIGQRKWLRFLPTKEGQQNARRLGDFEMFDEASRGSIGSAKLIFSLNAWYGLHTSILGRLPDLMTSRDVACLGAFITIVSVFFSAITQNVLGTYVSMQNGESLDLIAGRVPRSEYFNLTDQPPDSELTLRTSQLAYHVQLRAIY